MKKQIYLFAVFFSILALFSCKEKQSYSKIENTKPPIEAHVHKIVIKEFIDAETYTYIYVEENDDKYWMAIPKTPVVVGNTYYYTRGMVMENFESKQLNKTFKHIIFANEIRTTKEANNSQDELQEKPKEVINTSKKDEVKITKPTNGISLKELFSKKKYFSNKTVIVRGKVVKVNNGIMSKNWVHIVDGTAYNNKSDLTITTAAMVKIGDIVIFKGIIATDKDLGQGYFYDILLEDAEVIK